MKGYLHYNLYTRPSCSKCKFKCFPRGADFTLGDFWGLKSDLEDDKGTSLVLLNNKKSEELWSNITGVVCEIHDFDEAIYGNACFYKSIKYNKKGKKFLKALSKMSFSKAMTVYGKDTFIYIFIEKLKYIKKLITKYVSL